MPLKTLEEMKAANLPICQLTDVFSVGEPDLRNKIIAAKAKARICVYLSQFLPPDKECACCGNNIMGFTWGIAHGEGFCSVCGYPARAYHRPKDASGEAIFFSLILQYHPSQLERKPPQ